MIFTEQACQTGGKIISFQMSMEAFEDKRQRMIRVYLPQGYDGKRRFPVLYMHDAQNLFSDSATDNNNWHVNCEMQKLQKEGLSAIVVGIDNASTRMSELCPNMPVNPSLYDICNIPHEKIHPTGHLYAQFVAEQLKPVVDERFMTLPETENTAIGGASMGGLMSLYMLLAYPAVYSKAMVFSPNFVTHERDILMKWLNDCNYAKLQNHRAFLFHGGVGLEAANWPYVQTVFNALRDHGMEETQLALLYDSRQPHFETAWRKYFGEAFRFLFAQGNAGTDIGA